MSEVKHINKPALDEVRGESYPASIQCQFIPQIPVQCLFKERGLTNCAFLQNKRCLQYDESVVGRAIGQRRGLCQCG